MTIWEFLGIFALAVIFLGLICWACSAPEREDIDTTCARNTLLVIFGFWLFIYTGSVFSGPPPPRDPKAFSVWNSTWRDRSKSGWQLLDYRKPSPHLPAEEYMMGVEMAKSNACKHFNFNHESDIARFRRCAHFFPELYTEYRVKHQGTVGYSFD
jgi:hypothetical protein